MRLKITLKSGRVYKTPLLKDWKMEYNSSGIVSISCDKLFNRKYGLVLGSLDLAEIEAIEKIV